MPIYEYECKKCGKCHEVMQKFSDAPMTVCPDCGGQVKKLISNTTFVLKGSGWYVTDYASPDRKRGSDSEKKSPGKKTAAAKNDGKAEPKTEPKAEAKNASTPTDK